MAMRHEEDPTNFRKPDDWYVKCDPNNPNNFTVIHNVNGRPAGASDTIPEAIRYRASDFLMKPQHLDPRLNVYDTKSDVPKFTTVAEQSRTYFYPNGEKITLDGVTSINVSKSGTHRLNLSNGKKRIMPPGWLSIEFDAPHWTF